VGLDTRSFHDGLRYVLRQDPDIILVGEIRDLETMSTTLMAADTGHLVLSTLHTTDVVQTVQRIISFYPPHQHDEVRMSIASNLRAVVAQRLIPRRDGAGRVPACEILVNTQTIREFILTRKSMGGIRTDLDCRVLDGRDEPISGLYAVGEAAGFGGGGVHGLRALEGTFLGSCVFTGRRAARAIARGTAD